MSDKVPIIAVDIDPDQKFKEFHENFVKFKKLLDTLPGSWNAAKLAAEAAGTPLKKQLSTAKAIAEAAAAAATAQTAMEAAEAAAERRKDAAKRRSDAADRKAAQEAKKAADTAIKAQKDQESADKKTADAKAKTQKEQEAAVKKQADEEAKAEREKENARKKSESEKAAEVNREKKLKEQAAAEAKKKQNDQETREKLREKEAVRARHDAAMAMQQLAGRTGTIAGNIEKATKNLLKWVGISGAIGGLLGFGVGLFGLDRLGSSAGAALRSAQGLGLKNSGEQQAFNVNYSRYVDPDSLLGKVADAKSDYSKRWAFGAMGIDPNSVNKQDPAQLAVELTKNAKRLFDNSDQSQSFADSHGLTQFFTMDELRRLHQVTMKDLNASESGYHKDASLFNVDPKIQKQWQDFTVKMNEAGTAVENTLIRGLSPLAEPLGRLSGAVSKVLDAFLSQPLLQTWINDLAGVLDHFATYLGTPQFQTDVKNFADDVGLLAHAIGQAFDWLISHFKQWGLGGAAASGVADATMGTNASGLYAPTKNPVTSRDKLASFLYDVAQGGSSYGVVSDPAYRKAGGAEPNAAYAAAFHLGETGSQIGSFLQANGNKLNAAKDAWCAAFVNAALNSVGVKGDGSNVATSFANWGQATDPSKPKQGDVLVLMRGHKAGDVGGHVGIATGNTRMQDGKLQVQMISGNEGDGSGSVQTTWEDPSKLIGRSGTESMPLGTTFAVRGNNPGNMKAWFDTPSYKDTNGKSWASFPSIGDGVTAMDQQLGLYESRDKINTLGGLISKYDSGDSPDQIKSYVQSVSKDTGIGANDKVDSGNLDTMSKILSSMITREGVTKLSPAAVKILITNNTGGSAVVSASQLAH